MKKFYKTNKHLFTLIFLLTSISRGFSQNCTIIKTPNDSSTCINATTTFHVIVTGGCIIKIVDWDFGDGNLMSSTFATVGHTYTTSSNNFYTVKATVKCIDGSVITCTTLVRVKEAPEVKLTLLTPAIQCEKGNMFVFKDESVGKNNAKIVYRSIAWGDGANNSVSGSPAIWPGTITHNFSSWMIGINGIPKCYDITEIVIDEFGCVSRKEYPCLITVSGRKDLSFTSSYVIHTDSTLVTFTNTSVNFKAALQIRPTLLKRFIWDYGDGTSYVSPLWPSISDPYWNIHQHNYKNKMGPFKVSFIVTDSLDCTDTFTLNNAADNIYTLQNFQVGLNGNYSDSASACYKNNFFSFKIDEPKHPKYIFKTSYNFGEPASGINNIYPQKPGDPTLWNINHSFSSCGKFKVLVTLTAYQPNGTTVISTKTDTAFVTVFGPSAQIQDPAKGICVLNRIQCHIKDTVYFSNISKYCQADSALKKRDGITDSIAAPTVFRIWDFDDLANAMPCTTYSDPVFNFARFGHRIADTMNVNKNCNFSLDSLPKHWYTPGKERCYNVKLSLTDLKTGCADEQIISLPLQAPKASYNGKSAIELLFEGKKCLSDGNDNRKVKLKWSNTDPLCANQFVWINFDSACGITNFTPQTAFNPILFAPPMAAYGCSYNGGSSIGTPAIPFSQQGHQFPKEYTRQYTNTCDPNGNVTIGMVVQNGCDSAVVSFQDSLWVYWTGCEWNYCTYTNASQKTACMSAHPNSASYPAYARLNEAKKIHFFNSTQKATALAALPGGQVVCFACRDTFWYHNAIHYSDLYAQQEPSQILKTKYCINEEETFCPSGMSIAQKNMLSVTWTAYAFVPGRTSSTNIAGDTTYAIIDSIYNKPVYKRLRWTSKQYRTKGIFTRELSTAADITNDYPRAITIDSGYCYKVVNGNLTKIITSIDTFIRDSIKCQKFKFTSPGKWLVNLNVTNTDSCDKANEGTRYPIIVGNKIDFNLNDTVFCVGEFVQPSIAIRYWLNKPSPPFTDYDTRDYWNDKSRNPNSGGFSNKEVYYIKWGDGGSFIKYDTSILSIRSHAYTNTGNYTITIVWKDSTGCLDTMILENIIHIVKPNIDFRITSQDLSCDHIIQFIDSSWISQDTSLGAIYDDLNALSPAPVYDWDFGDGTLHSGLKNPTHVYQNNGDYNVTLTLTTAQGCSNTITKKFHITGPVLDYVLQIGVNDTLPMPATTGITILNNTDTTFRWAQIKWGDGTDTIVYKKSKPASFNFTPPNTVLHTYKYPGRYCIKVLIIDTMTNKDGSLNICERNYPCPSCDAICVTVFDPISGIEGKYKIIGAPVVFPNPSSGVFNIKGDQIRLVTVLDITGKTIMQTAATTIDLSQFDDGLYFFNIQDENGNTKTVKVQLMHQ